MHKKLTIFIFILFSSNALGLQFYSTNKSHTYNISRFSQQISKQYKSHFKVFSVLVAANNNANKTYKKQLEELNKLNAETLSLVIIQATANKENTHGYHTSTEQAKSILSKKEFIVVIYSPKGKKMLSSTKVISASNIKKTIKEHNKAIKKDV